MRASLIALLLIAAPALAGQPKKRPEDHVQGKQLWEEHCWFCHGARNDGEGPAAASLTTDVPDLRGAITPNRYDALAQLVLNGSASHPAYGIEMDKYEARRIMIYLEKLEREAATEKRKPAPKDEPAPKQAPAEDDAPQPPAEDEP